MHYDFIEIGTSDFSTHLQTEPGETTGIAVEPLSEYIDRLPDRKGWYKVKAAIGEEGQGSIDVYGVDAKEVEARGLKNWLRGCNKVGDYHPSVVKYCEDNGIDISEICYIEEVKVITLHTLLSMYNVTSIGTFKVDTEGMDYIIMNQYVEHVKRLPQLKAKSIQFESNILTDESKTQLIIKELVNLGYGINRTETDVFAKLKEV